MSRSARRSRNPDARIPSSLLAPLTSFSSLSKSLLSDLNSIRQRFASETFQRRSSLRQLHSRGRLVEKLRQANEVDLGRLRECEDRISRIESGDFEMEFQSESDVSSVSEEASVTSETDSVEPEDSLLRVVVGQSDEQTGVEDQDQTEIERESPSSSSSGAAVTFRRNSRSGSRSRVVESTSSPTQRSKRGRVETSPFLENRYGLSRTRTQTQTQTQTKARGGSTTRENVDILPAPRGSVLDRRKRATRRGRRRGRGRGRTRTRTAKTKARLPLHVSRQTVEREAVLNQRKQDSDSDLERILALARRTRREVKRDRVLQARDRRDRSERIAERRKRELAARESISRGGTGREYEDENLRKQKQIEERLREDAEAEKRRIERERQEERRRKVEARREKKREEAHRRKLEQLRLIRIQQDQIEDLGEAIESRNRRIATHSTLRGDIERGSKNLSSLESAIKKVQKSKEAFERACRRVGVSMRDGTSSLQRCTSLGIFRHLKLLHEEFSADAVRRVPQWFKDDVSETLDVVEIVTDPRQFLASCETRWRSEDDDLDSAADEIEGGDGDEQSSIGDLVGIWLPSSVAPDLVNALAPRVDATVLLDSSAGLRKLYVLRHELQKRLLQQFLENTIAGKFLPVLIAWRKRIEATSSRNDAELKQWLRLWRFLESCLCQNGRRLCTVFKRDDRSNTD